MADILHDFPIAAPVAAVFEAFSSPPGLDAWWTSRSAGFAELGAVYTLDFGPEYSWRGGVRRCERNVAFEWELMQAMPDWIGTRVGAEFSERDGLTWIRFYHTGWPSASEHYRISTYCWAMYLRVLKRYLEHGEMVPYERRLDV
jgi:uncharacterized protein YndB with AHSA1/START domain